MGTSVCARGEHGADVSHGPLRGDGSWGDHAEGPVCPQSGEWLDQVRLWVTHHCRVIKGNESGNGSYAWGKNRNAEFGSNDGQKGVNYY